MNIGLVILAISLFLGNIYVLFRNNEVYILRTKLRNEGYNRYGSLPSYHKMMWQFWKPVSSYEDKLEQKGTRGKSGK